MEYRKHRIEYLKTTIEYFLFGGEGETKGAHLVLHVDPKAGSYEKQLMVICKAYHKTLGRKTKLRGMVPAFCRYFLSGTANQWEVLQAVSQEEPSYAVSVVQQPPLDGSRITLWVYLTSERNAAYKHYWTAGAGMPCGNSEQQMKTLLKSYEANLTGKGYTLASDRIRTWIFVQNVDVNYAGIVEARRENFVGQGLTESTHYIASTGMEGRHADSKIHVLLDTYTVRGLQPGQVTYLHALSRLSPTALYGMTFERGTSVEYDDRRHLFINGTASIDHRGEVVRVGNVRKQTRRMWENVEKLLKEGKAGLADVAQIIAYLRDASNYPVVRAMFAERFPQIPIQLVAAAMCRPTWLIEMECITVAGNDNSSYQSS